MTVRPLLLHVAGTSRRPCPDLKSPRQAKGFACRELLFRLSENPGYALTVLPRGLKLK